MQSSCLHVESLTREVESRKILDNISLNVESGKLVAIIGPNGAGKTTLLKEMVGFKQDFGLVVKNNIQQGSLYFTKDGEQKQYPIGKHHAFSVAKNKKNNVTDMRIAYMPQFEFCHWDISVADMLGIAARHWISSVTEQTLAIERIAKAVNIDNLLAQKYQTLSGGQRSRVLIARSLIHQPDWFFSDEPIASLDVRYQHEILSLFKDYVQNSNKPIGAVLVLHDLNLVYQYCDEVIVLKQGRCIAKGDVKSVMTDALLSETYDVPIISQRIENRSEIDGVSASESKIAKDKVVFIDGL